MARMRAGRWTCCAGHGELGRAAGLGERPPLGNKKCWVCGSTASGVGVSGGVSLDLKSGGSR